MPGTTKRVATVVWSISIAVVLLVLTTSVMLPSTKRARISFDDEERATPTAQVISDAATQPATAIPSSKVAILKFDPPATAPESAPHISSSKSGVFRIEAPTATTKPTHIFGSKAAVFDIDKAGIVPTGDPTTYPSTAPSR